MLSPFKTTALLLLFSVSLLAQNNSSWSLQACIDTALKNNVQIKQSTLQSQLAENSIDVGVARLFPTVNGSAGYNWSFGLNIDPVTNIPSRDQRQTNSLSVTAQWVLFDGNRNFNTLAQNRIDHAASLYRLEDMKNNTSLNVASQYIQILLNKEILKIAEEQLKTTDLQVKRMTDLVNAGSQPTGSLFDLQAQQARDNQSMIAAKNNLKVSKLQLSQTIQIPFQDDFDIIDYEGILPGGEVLTMGAENIYNSALENQPSISAAELDVQSAEKQVAMAKGGFYPSLSLFGSVGTNYSDQIRDLSLAPRDPSLIGITSTGDDVFDFGGVNFSQGDIKSLGEQYNDNLNQFVGFSLSIPIWSGMQLKNGVRSAKIGRENARLDLINNQNTLRQTIERAYADAAAAYETYAASESSVKASQESFNYAKVRYESGTINQFDYENARNSLTRAQAQLAQSRFDYIFRIKTLEFYLRGSIQP